MLPFETPDETTEAIRMSNLNISGLALCQKNCSRKFTELERGLVRPFSSWPFCTDEKEPNFANCQGRLQKKFHLVTPERSSVVA